MDAVPDAVRTVCALLHRPRLRRSCLRLSTRGRCHRRHPRRLPRRRRERLTPVPGRVGGGPSECWGRVCRRSRRTSAERSRTSAEPPSRRRKRGRPHRRRASEVRSEPLWQRVGGGPSECWGRVCLRSRRTSAERSRTSAEPPSRRRKCGRPHRRRASEVRSERFGRGPQRMLGEGLSETPPPTVVEADSG
jgi:hypothetical protein